MSEQGPNVAAMSPVDRLREATDQMVSAGYLVAKKDGLTGPRHECERLVKLIIDAALSSPEPVGEVSDD